MFAAIISIAIDIKRIRTSALAMMRTLNIAREHTLFRSIELSRIKSVVFTSSCSLKVILTDSKSVFLRFLVITLKVQVDIKLFTDFEWTQHVDGLTGNSLTLRAFFQSDQISRRTSCLQSTRTMDICGHIGHLWIGRKCDTTTTIEVRVCNRKFNRINRVLSHCDQFVEFTTVRNVQRTLVRCGSICDRV